MGNLSFESSEVREGKGVREGWLSLYPEGFKSRHAQSARRLEFAQVCQDQPQPERSGLDKPRRRAAGRRILTAVRQRQVGLRAHLDQPRGGTLELVGLDA